MMVDNIKKGLRRFIMYLDTIELAKDRFQMAEYSDQGTESPVF
jgi:hypothetical protein